MSHNLNFSHRDIAVICSGDSLVIENAALRRAFDLSSGTPMTTELMGKKSGRLAAGKNEACDFSFIGMNMPGYEKVTDYRIESVGVSAIEASMFDGEKVEVRILIHEPVQQLTFERICIIYPELPVFSTVTTIKSLSVPNLYWSRRADAGNFNRHIPEFKLESRGDSLALNDMQPYKSVKFTGRTDYTNDLVDENFGFCRPTVSGNLLFCRGSDGSGLFFLQEAPPSEERRDFEAYDFRMDDNEVFSCGWGIEPHDVSDEPLKSYRHVIGLFDDDGTDGTAALKNYLKVRFPLGDAEKGSVTVNPWGCGQFPQLVNESFLKKELKASGGINATHYQIDDGWQYGRSLHELEQNNRCPGREFWSINNDLLPSGFSPLLKTARDSKVELALWIAPSANRHYKDWKEMADLIYEYHSSYGFKFVKIDYVRTRTKEAEDNLEKMLKYLREKSGGRIYFNLDTTNGQRPGYFLFLEYGNIFLENRYEFRGMPYHPESTLLNLWKLAKYMRPQSLQIEFCDPQLIVPEYYAERALHPPDEYRCDYWAAVTLFANPLVWLAPSRLQPEVKTVYAEMMSLYREYSEDIFAGEIFPIGVEPSGSAITGFQSHNKAENRGYFILYCEKAAQLSGKIDLKLVDKNRKYIVTEIKPGSGAGEICEGAFSISFQSAASWKLFRYE